MSEFEVLIYICAFFGAILLLIVFYHVFIEEIYLSVMNRIRTSKEERLRQDIGRVMFNYNHNSQDYKDKVDFTLRFLRER